MAISRGESAWCAEFCIPDSLLGGWNQTVPVLLSASGKTFPDSAIDTDPSTWPEVGLRDFLPIQPNSTPVADAGPDQILTILSGFNYALSGDQSFDPDGDPLTYRWIQTLGSPVALSDPETANPTFMVPFGSSYEVLRFVLVVSDGIVDSAIDEVLVELFPTETHQPSGGKSFSLSEDGASGRFVGLEPNQRYFLTHSHDLLNWTTDRTIKTDGFGNLNFFDPIDPNLPRCFYMPVKAP